MQVQVGTIETPDSCGHEVSFTPGEGDGPALVAPDGTDNLSDTVQNEAPRCIAVEPLLLVVSGQEKESKPSPQQEGGVSCYLEKEKKIGKQAG